MVGLLLFKAFFILLLIPNVASMAFLGRPAALIFVEFIPKLFLRLFDSRDSRLALPIEFPDFILAVWGAVNYRCGDIFMMRNDINIVS